MAFQVSPGVLTKEIDLTQIIPAVSTSIGAVAIYAKQGPVDEVVSISSEKDLVNTFGKPDTDTFEYFFTASNFLLYSNALRVVRITNSSILNATANSSGLLVKNTQDYEDNYADGSGAVGHWVARTAGTWGNNLKVSVCPSATAYEQTSANNSNLLVDDATTAVGDTTITVDDGTLLNVGDIINFNETGGYEYRVTAISTNDVSFCRKEEPLHFDANDSNGLHTAVADDSPIRRRWQYYDSVEGAPGTSDYVSQRGGSNDEMHIVVIDEDGGISGAKGTVLETYSKVSKASDGKSPQGDDNYYPNVIKTRSEYIYWMDHNTSGTTWGDAAAGTTYTDIADPFVDTLAGGSDGTAPTNGEKKTAYEKFSDTDSVDVGLIMAGPADQTHADNVITIAENRRDAIAFISPERSDVVNVTNNFTQLSNVKDFHSNVKSTSYAVLDSGYVYKYDRYNDVFRFVPLNGDVAGLCARTDLIADSFYSPAGLNRGILKGAVKLAFNPTKPQRDELYPNRINPVVSQPGTGTLLFGDKTALKSPSAFDRINVRRLFILLQKAIATAAKFQLFEFNDEFTRAQFRNIVEPFLRDIQGRRGVVDFLVVCDETNNTGEVIDRNEFVADIFIKPARSINFITLNFIATRTGVAFEEVAG